MRNRSKDDMSLVEFNAKLKRFKNPLILINPVTHSEMTAANIKKCESQINDEKLILKVIDLVSEHSKSDKEVNTHNAR